MKTKKIEKLGLNKMTVANLMDEKMSNVLGGKERCAYSVVMQSCFVTDFPESCPLHCK